MYIEPMDVPLFFMVYSAIDSDQGPLNRDDCVLLSFEVWRAVI